MSRRRRGHNRGVGKWARIFLYIEQGPDHPCALCGGYVSPEDASVDHRRPVSKGGTDAQGNLQIAHKSCNEAKGNREELH